MSNMSSGVIKRNMVIVKLGSEMQRELTPEYD